MLENLLKILKSIGLLAVIQVDGRKVMTINEIVFSPLNFFERVHTLLSRYFGCSKCDGTGEIYYATDHSETRFKTTKCGKCGGLG